MINMINEVYKDLKELRKFLKSKAFMKMVIALFLILVFFAFIKKLFIIMGLVILGGISQIYKRFIPVPVGFELLIFSTVIIAKISNPFIAWVSAMIMIVINIFAAGDYGLLPLFRVFMYTGICMALPFMLGLDILTVGVISAVIANVIYLVLSAFIYPAFFAYIYANVLNIIFNALIFSKFAEPVLKAVGLIAL